MFVNTEIFGKPSGVYTTHNMYVEGNDKTWTGLGIQ